MIDPILNQPQFHDEDKARECLEALRWPNGVVCPHCSSIKNHYKLVGKSHRKGLWKCIDCRKQFTVTVGTVLEYSKIKLHVWLMAVYLVYTTKNHIESIALHKLLGVSPRIAKSMVHRICEDMELGSISLFGINGSTIEADETYCSNTKLRAQKLIACG